MAENESEQTQDKTSTEEVNKVRMAELERLAQEKDGELNRALARIGELEKSLNESREQLKASGEALGEAVTSYRTMVVQTNPEVPEELIKGETVAALDKSMCTARDLVRRVREGLESEVKSVRVPMGAPQRTGADLSGLTAREKIQLSLNSKY